ncbi:lysophospholipid acyltransferase family protein [Poriferisphaera sp. WC338]|uniref:lysophospholipid acyltransferase family protein n=1 Tax=Poriferisphaera sp. WC338 TaxID=3425129 RepID=UPI003D817F49
MAKKENDNLRLPNTLYHTFCWWFVTTLSLIWFKIFYRFKSTGSHNVPKKGSVLIIANHQSFLDPPIMGAASYRRSFFSLARATLWNSKTLGHIMNALKGFPVDQENADIKAMRDCISILKADHGLMLFPEGARTEDGKTAPFEMGVFLMIKRSGCTVVPAGIEGAYDVWPRGQSKPKLFGRIAVNFGEPIPPETFKKMKGEEALKMLHDRVIELQARSAKQIGR